jgi:hypothetical protein
MIKVQVLGLAAAALALAGCAYNAPVAVAPNLNVYSSYGEKLPGRYALLVDGEAFSQTVRPTGYQCSAHSFPLDMKDAFRQSTIQTIRQIVDDVEIVQSPLSADALERAGLRGQIIVRADSMTARIQFIPGFWSATTDSNVDLTANMSVDGPAGRLLGTTAEGTGHGQGEAGAFCGGGATAVAEASEHATKQLLGQLGERLSNSPRLRAVATADVPRASPVAYSPTPTAPAPSRGENPAATAPRADAAPSSRRSCVRVVTDSSQSTC